MKQVLCFAFGLLCVSFAVALPTGLNELEPCKRDDPEINDCILKQLQKAVVVLKDGVPEYDIPSTDPILIDFMAVEGDLEAIKLKMIMKNMTLGGHSTAQFTKVKFDPNSLTGEIAFKMPAMTFQCTYYATGRLFVIPLESSANFDGLFTGIEMSFNFRLKTVVRKGVEYFTVDKMNMKLFANTAHADIVSLNPVNQGTVNVIQDFFNNNNRLVLDTVNPIANANGGEFYKHILEKFLRHVPANKLLQ